MTKTLSIFIIVLFAFSCKKADPKKSLEVANLKEVSSEPIILYSAASKTAIATTSAAINDFANINGDLYLVGNFASLGSANSRCLANYDGTSLYSVTNNLANGSNIRVINYFNSKVVIGGIFSTTSSATNKYIGSLQSGVVATPYYSTTGQIFSLCNTGSKCYFGGNVNSVNGWGAGIGAINQNNSLSYYSYLNSSSSSVYAIESFNSTIFLGGSLTSSYDKNIVYYDGSYWQKSETGFNSTVYDLINFDNKLFAGGSMSYNGNNSTPLNFVNELSGNGYDWKKTGTNNLPGYCTSLVVHNNQLLACGNNGNQGYIYRHNRSNNKWENCLGTGISLKSMQKIISFNGFIYGLEKDFTSGQTSFVRFD